MSIRPWNSRRYPAQPIIAAALLVLGCAGTGLAQDGECVLASPSEVSNAFEGKISVEVQQAYSDGCTFTISGRSFSFVRVSLNTDPGDLMANRTRSIEEGSLQGELVEDLGERALVTDSELQVELMDGSVLTVSISIYGDSLNPLLEDEEKEQGLLTLGRLVVERL